MPAGDNEHELEQIRFAAPPTADAGTDQLTSEPEEEAPRPEGGKGWVVVTACACCTFFCVGHSSYAWGVVQAHLTRQQLAPASTLAFIGALAIASQAFLALVSTVLIRRFGVRPMSLIGISFMGAGATLASFCTDHVGLLFLTAGLMIGVAESLLFMSTIIVTGMWFLLRRGTAMGIVYGGGALGGVILSLSFEQLIQKVGLPWTFRIYGFAIFLIGYPAAWLLVERPVRQARHLVDLSLFRDHRFLLLIAGAVIGCFPLFVPAFFLPSYATTIGLTSAQGAGLVAGYNVASLVGRLGFGTASDRFGPLNCLNTTLLLNAFSFLAIWPVSTTLTPLIFFVVLNGAANGGFFTVMPTVVGSLFGPARVGVAMAMVVSSFTAPFLLGSPIAGYIVEAYGGTDAGLDAYRPPMFYAGSLSTASLCCILTIRFMANKSIRARI